MSARFEVFYDGECPLCVREIRLLERLDRTHRVRFTDIASPGFDPRSIGVPFETLMAKIHGRTLEGEGRLVEGVEVFRQLYDAVGFGPIVALTRLWGVRHLLDLGYGWFARNRLALTGRSEDCASGRCAVPRVAVPANV